jgi:hypothetical protein
MTVIFFTNTNLDFFSHISSSIVGTKNGASASLEEEVSEATEAHWGWRRLNSFLVVRMT